MKQVILELLQEKRRMLSIAAVLILLNILLYAVLASYLEPSVTKSQNSVNELRQRVAIAGRSDVSTVYQRGVEDVKRLLGLIPEKRQFPRVLGDILDAAASNAVVTGTVSYKPQNVKGQDLLAYSISMSVSGSYAAVKSFLSDLQQNGEMIIVDGISLSKNDLFEESVGMDLHLTVYLQGKEGA